MSISGLNIYSPVSKEHWILDCYNENTQDKNSRESHTDQLSQVNIKNRLHCWWNVNYSSNGKFYSRKNLGYGTSSSLTDENEISIAKALAHLMGNWSKLSSCVGLSYQMKVLNNSLLTLIRDSLFLRVSNLWRNSKQRGVHGFIISSNKDFDFHGFYLNFCKKSFWLTEIRGREPDFIYTINLSEYLRPLGCNICYINKCYLGTCCCQRCTKVLDYLGKNHKDLVSSENLKRLVFKEQSSLMEFLKHNKKYETLEHKLLKITLNGLLLKTQLIKNLEPLLSENNSTLKSLFRSCFALFKNLDSLFYTNESGKNTLNPSCLVLDLLNEYTELWEELDLPIFSFAFINQKKDSLVNEMDLKDSHLTPNSISSFLQSSNHYKYSTFISDEIVDERSKLEYFRDLLKENPMNTNRSKQNENENDLRSLMRLTRGYSMEEMKVLYRMAKCESFKEKDNNFRGEPVKFFEKAVHLRPIVDFSTTFGLYPEMSTFSNSLNFSPLKVSNGKVVPKIGLESMVLPEKTLEQINRFLSQELSAKEGRGVNYSVGLIVKGQSGVGKTSLAHCLAEEMNSVFFGVNILSFLRSQVGLSEKLLHSFFSKIRNQFSGSNTGKFWIRFIDSKKYELMTFIGSRRDLVKCVVLLEGLEALKGGDGYLKRLVWALSKELQEFSSNCRFQLDSSVLFITTCENYEDLPEEITKVFSERLELIPDKMNEDLAKRCFELFLNHRCDFLERIDELVEHIKKRNYMEFLTPIKIATLVKNATLKEVTNYSSTPGSLYRHPDESHPGRLVSLQTMISTVDSTFK